ncbi:MAG: type II secretion system F family protein, partial [Armatimonadetes bacterium]|nr:type II secretion system F family protein [Armatimonadota bacterium]
MPVFLYEVKDATGNLKKDSIEAPNIKIAQQKLQEQKYIIIKIKEKSAGVSGTD